MSVRSHVGVVVLPSVSATAEITGLRRALGDPDLERVPVHCTVAPPVRLDGAALSEALRLLRSAAAGREPFELVIGPVASFEPVSPTVHLEVHDDGSLAALRTDVFQGPLTRRTHPFVPHVTLLAEADTDTITAARRLLGHYRRTTVVDRLTLLVEDRSGEAPRWVPAADVDLSGVRVVARGPLPLELSAGTVVDPEAAVLLDGATPSPMGRHPTVVTARREGAVVGVAWGSAAGGDPEGVVVRADARRQGVGTHLRREWAFRSTQRISR